MSCGNQTLGIGRPSQSQFNNNCGSTTKSSAAGCGDSDACKYVTPHGRNLSPRKHREKVREDIKDMVLLSLGAPVIKVELDSQQLDAAINYILKIIEDFAGREYFDYYTFNTTPGKSVYKMPDDVGVIRNVFYREQGANFAFNSQDLGGVLPLEYFYPGSAGGSVGMINPTQPMWGNMGEWVLFKQYENMYARTSSQIGGWEWVSDLGYIKLYPVPCGCSTAMVHYMQKCKDWKEMTQVMVEGVYAYCLIILGNIRGKYSSPPGPGGGMQLDGEYQRNKGYELFKEWKEDLIYKFGDICPITMD